MLSPTEEHRQAARYALDMPVMLNGSPSRSRDLSSTGVFVLLDEEPDDLTTISLEMTLPTETGQPLKFVGVGNVVRVERQGDQVGLAVSLQTWQLR